MGLLLPAWGEYDNSQVWGHVSEVGGTEWDGHMIQFHLRHLSAQQVWAWQAKVVVPRDQPHAAGASVVCSPWGTLDQRNDAP